MSKTDVAIIGGGASGLVAAIMLKQRRPDLSVVIFEAFDRVGKKLATTGNGRCNITNSNIKTDNYHGDPALAEKLLADFPLSSQIDFFKSTGMLLVQEEDGKMYPRSLQAGSVTDALRFTCDELGVQTRLGDSVKAVARGENSNLLVKADSGTYTAACVIVACGGKAGGKLGSLSGYDILKSLGHKIENLYPSIVQLKTETDLTRSLKGVKVTGTVTINSEAGTRTESGEILFTDYGISGPPVMQVSRFANFGKTSVRLDLIPELTSKEISDHLISVRDMHPGRSAQDIFAGFINKRLGTVIMKSCGGDLSTNAGSIKTKTLIDTAVKLKKLELKVLGTTGFENAQVTAGGAQTSQFFDNLMSKKVKGLFACGEVLNIDGDCGGYNLAYCWASANAAVNGIIAYIGAK